MATFSLFSRGANNHEVAFSMTVSRFRPVGQSLCFATFFLKNVEISQCSQNGHITPIKLSFSVTYFQKNEFCIICTVRLKSRSLVFDECFTFSACRALGLIFYIFLQKRCFPTARPPPSLGVHVGSMCSSLGTRWRPLPAPWVSVVALWPPLAALGCPWPPLAASGRPWLPLAAPGWPWPLLAAPGRPSAPLAAPGRPWPPLAAPGFFTPLDAKWRKSPSPISLG